MMEDEDAARGIEGASVESESLGRPAMKTDTLGDTADFSTPPGHRQRGLRYIYRVDLRTVRGEQRSEESAPSSEVEDSLAPHVADPLEQAVQKQRKAELWQPRDAAVVPEAGG